MGEPWAEVENDLSKAGCLGRLGSLQVVSGKGGKKGRNCQTMEGNIDCSDLGGMEGEEEFD